MRMTDEEVLRIKEKLTKYEQINPDPDSLRGEYIRLTKMQELVETGHLIPRTNENRVKALTKEELIIALKCCANDRCSECPACSPRFTDSCNANILYDAAIRLERQR